MGRFNEMSIEQGEGGFSYVGDEYVCAACITDAPLASFVSSTAGVGEGHCDFCSATAPVIGLHPLFVYMSSCIQQEYSPASLSINVPSREWGISVPSIWSVDLLDHFGQPLGDGDLQQAFIDAFEDDWIADGVWAGTSDEWLSAGWDRFVDELKTTSRFVFLRRAPSEGRMHGVDIDPTEMLDRLAGVLDECECVVPFPAGQPVVRARKHRPDETLTTPEELGAPPAWVAGSQRMSPPGISFFYGATDENTALAELRGLDGEVATASAWVTQRDCFMVDLARVSPLPSIFDEDEAHRRPAIRFLRLFVDEISRPIRAHDNTTVDYVPTQVVAEYIRHCVRGSSGQLVEGLMYNSAVLQGGTNLVFFPDDESSVATPLLALVGEVHRHEAVSTTTVWERRPAPGSDRRASGEAAEDDSVS